MFALPRSVHLTCCCRLASPLLCAGLHGESPRSRESTYDNESLRDNGRHAGKLGTVGHSDCPGRTDQRWARRNLRLLRGAREGTSADVTADSVPPDTPLAREVSSACTDRSLARDMETYRSKRGLLDDDKSPYRRAVSGTRGSSGTE